MLFDLYHLPTLFPSLISRYRLHLYFHVLSTTGKCQINDFSIKQQNIGYIIMGVLYINALLLFVQTFYIFKKKLIILIAVLGFE